MDDLVLPDGDATHDALPNGATTEQTIEWSTRQLYKRYSFVCTRCGHLLSFNASWVAANVMVMRGQT